MKKSGHWLLLGLFALACDSGGGGGSGGGGSSGQDGGGEERMDAGDSGQSGRDGRVRDGEAPPEDARVEADRPVPTDGPVVEPDGPVPDARTPDGAVPDGRVPDATPPDGQVPPPDGLVACEEGAVEACGQDVCAGSTRTCTDGAWSDCQAPAELCDGLDNDCDGLVDNGFELGAACVSGLGACEVAGVTVCAPDGQSAICGAAPGAPAPEVCDGLDNDCDGAVDGTPEGGLVTECYDGPPETLGVGACQAGASVCLDSMIGACDGQILPQAEVCDGVDNDCDGLVDEGEDGQPLVSACYTGAAGTEGVGLCHGGLAVCGEGGVFGPCQGEIAPAVEICDLADNDCNGVADEVAGGCACTAGATQDCYAGPDGTAGVGVCAHGTQTCQADGSAWGPCEGATLPGSELCDGLDNDCNGSIDDAVAGVGVACTAGEGVCRAEGLTVCDPLSAAVTCDAALGVPSPELCDGLDNDCNGRVDDGLGVGQPCAGGEGACLAVGTFACDEAGGVACTAAVGQPIAERCDNVDNDCNGLIDDGLGLGDACTLGVGACAAPGVRICDPNGDTICLGRALPPGVEICDGIDNDCDGVVDNGNPGGGAACPVDGAQGGCALGQSACVDGALVCQQLVFPAPEACDGLDNDCDGVADNGPNGELLTAPCYSGPEGTQDVGLCAGGVSTCEGGVFGACVGEIVPVPEICDSQDNDCDGNVDNLAGGPEAPSCACVPGEQRACYSGPAGTDGVGACHSGVQICNADGLSFGPCAGETLPAGELCDGQDNDCNDRIDDGVPGTGAGCGAGIGACHAEGQTVCDAETGEIVCNAVAGQPTAEICDALDNDCDGQTDQGLGLGAGCQVGVGACAAQGVMACDGRGGVACTAVAGAPSAELCDGLDNDCDGQIDNGLNLGAACTAGVGVCAKSGLLVCGAEGAVVCSAIPSQPVAETCDGLDNDCDGTVDDGNPGGGGACNTGNVGACGVGVLTCQQGALACVQRNQPTLETCDGADNDCDGQTDEDQFGDPLVRSCYEGAAGTNNVGICHGGFRTCGGGQYGACVGQVVPGVEICDGVDNNCDGTVDNPVGGALCACVPGTVRDCYTGAAGTANVGLCHGGRQTCLANGTGYGACQGEVIPAAEVCDGADNDCNAAVDDAPGVDQPCSTGVGECAVGGLRICDPVRGVLVCDAVAAQPGAEICDNLDNDCDGIVDDVAGLGGHCEVGVGACTRAGSQICDLATGGLRCDAVAGEPGREVCDGIDNNCDGNVDEGVLPGVGVECQSGLGACLAAGLTVCAGGDGVVCGAVAGDPQPESCDGIDNDCNGAVDDNTLGAGVACTNGVGACARDGSTVCRGAELFCDAVAGAPVAELCDGIDNDCNGQIDDGRDCTTYTSCLDAYSKGADRSAVYRLRPPGLLNPVDVYCDMTTDNGGWTLVGSTLAATLNDQGQAAYYADLSTLAPAAAHGSLWQGMRQVSERFDVRFACRDAVRAADAPMTVDLSFYRTPWYREVTTGTDAVSCFSEQDGAGQDMAPIGRRNNLTGELRARGEQWSYGYFEGEDACGDTGDFTVDFDDRGMGNNRSDGTDWGEDDNLRKCGRSGLATGQWFVFVRERRRVAVLGPDVVSSLLTAGIPAERLDYLDPNVPARLDANVYEALVLGRYTRDWSLMTPALADAIAQFALDGGSIVTESDGAAILSSGYWNVSFDTQTAEPALGLFPGVVSGGVGPGADTPVTPLAPVDSLFTGVLSPLQAGAGTEDFVFVHPVEGENIFLRTVATFPGDDGNLFPAGALPAVQRGRYCGGDIVLANFDYADNQTAAVRQFLTNATKDALLSPLPALEDPCPLPQRPNVMVCGNSDRPISEFLRGGSNLNVVAGCDPDPTTQAFLVTHGALTMDLLWNAAALQAYVRAGGIVISEYGTSNLLFNLIFSTAVPAGAQVGDCRNAIAPAVQFNSLDAFWDENRHSPPANNRRGCGFDLQGYPGITKLGGPTAQGVTLAYRDLGAGRVWLVEADWASNSVVDATLDASRGMMHYMIEHGPNPYLFRPLAGPGLQ